jgi:hypothetical protein
MIDNKKDKFGLLKTIAIVLLIIGLGVFAVNQVLTYYYKTEFLKSPCYLCGELNPEVKICIENLNKGRASYWNGSDWSDPFKFDNVNITISP